MEKNQAAAASKNFPMMDHGDPGRPNLLNERPRSGLIALEGCSRSEASQLLNDRMLYPLKRITLRLVIICMCSLVSFLHQLHIVPIVYPNMALLMT